MEYISKCLINHISEINQFLKDKGLYVIVVTVLSHEITSTEGFLIELVAHPNARSVPKKMGDLVNVYTRLKLCIHGVQLLQSAEVKEDNLRVEIRW